MSLPENGYTQPVEIVVGGALPRNGWVQPVEITNPSSVSMVIGGIVGGGTPGSVLFVDAAGNLGQNNASFFWDNTNNRIGIKNASPNATIDIGSTSTTGSTGSFVQRWRPAEAVSLPWNVTQGAATNAFGTRLNQTLEFGYNNNVNGGQESGTDSSWYMGFESYYAPDATHQWVEWYLEYFYTGAPGNGIRPFYCQVNRFNNTDAVTQLSGSVVSITDALANNIMLTCTASNKVVGIPQALNVGTTALASAQGDLAVGLTGANAFWFSASGDEFRVDGSQPVISWNRLSGPTQKWLSYVRNNGDWRMQDATGAADIFGITLAATGQAFFSASLGVGVISPSRQLDVLNASNPQIRATYTATTVYTDLKTDSSGRFSILPSGTGGQVLFNAGAIATPSIASQTTTTDGLYFAAAGDIRLASGSADIMRITGSGWVMPAGNNLYWASTGTTTLDFVLLRTATRTLTMQNGANACTWRVYGNTTGPIYTETSHDGTNAYFLQSGGNQIAFAKAAKATTDTTGYVCMTSSAGPPTGVPANIPTGGVPIHIDATNKFLYLYIGGWIKSTVYA